MSAFDEILAFSSIEKLNDFRQALISHKRGTLTSGSFAESMRVVFDTQTDDDEDSLTPNKIFLNITNKPQPGFIFDANGTDRALSVISNAGTLKLLDEFAGFYKFKLDKETEAWSKSDRAIKRKCIGRNLEDLIRKTDINYRTHGDRLHYYVVGLVTIEEDKSVNSYPLFLFPCNEVNKNSMTVEVEQTGFINFWLDKYYLEDTLYKNNKGYEVTIEENFPTLLNSISIKIANVQNASIDNITVDPKYSAVSIVTGFEPEYIDPVWDKLLKEQ
jgi:hypothetical protein